MNILVTGAAGMIGSYVVRGLLDTGHSVIGVDRVKPQPQEECLRLTSITLDLSSKEDLMRLFDDNKIDRAIHLAALAHTAGMKNLTWETYRKINVECAENVFEVCETHKVPVLFISTVDAIGMVKGLIRPDTTLNPISNYGKSKAMAEARLKEICGEWNIYRFSPVYTPEIKRDIEKRYYLNYPNWAYRIGKGGQFEVLRVSGAVSAMLDWVEKNVDNTIHVIKDPDLLDINDLIKVERAEGRAKHVIWLPRWAVVCGYYVIRFVFGKSNKTYLVFKALWPFRTIE